MATAPAFLTNHELDRFLGGGDSGSRQRQRLRQAHLLPTPVEVGKVRRFNIAVFPRFALAGLVRDLGTIPHATETMEAVTKKALRSNAFTEVCAAVRESALALQTWSFNELVQGVAERAADAVREWDEVVGSAERQLAEELGISFATEFGVVERVVNNICLVKLDSGALEHVPCTRVAAAAEKGHAVALERVKVLSKELGYLMPLERTTLDADDIALASWFAGMTAPASGAESTIAEAHTSTFEPLPYRRSRPRRGRWHGATTMTRVPADV